MVERFKSGVFMSSTFLIAGAGQIGSRHLQGLVKCKFGLQIVVFDPSPAALATAKFRWEEAGGKGSKHTVRWLEKFPSDLQSVDVAFITSSSRGRTNLVETISNLANIRYWILEKVLAQSGDELKRMESALTGCDGAWVNKPRRMMNWHRSLKRLFTNAGPFNVDYSAGLWGLACNSIHFIDLVSWWSDEVLISVDSNALDCHWYESKRHGFYEITGELVCRFSSGSVLKLRSEKEASPGLIQVECNDGEVWNIDEARGIAKNSDSTRSDGCVELQSDLSGRLADEILQTGACNLPTFVESAAMHSIFLDALLAHWNRSTLRRDSLVPIT